MKYGTGDSFLVENAFSSSISASAFFKIKEEVNWKEMVHKGGSVPRLVSLQGIIASDGSFPLYRHPTDEMLNLDPFSPIVMLIKVEKSEISVTSSLTRNNLIG
jgi:hypothetical protein